MTCRPTDRTQGMSPCRHCGTMLAQDKHGGWSPWRDSTRFTCGPRPSTPWEGDPFLDRPLVPAAKVATAMQDAIHKSFGGYRRILEQQAAMSQKLSRETL